MKLLTAGDLARLRSAAAASPRRRLNLNWHDPRNDRVQRFFNHLCPGTYVRPHRHSRMDKWEFTLVLDGAVDLLTFDDDGRVLERRRIEAGGELRAVEVPPTAWHSYVTAAGGATLLEIKEGPYDAELDKLFAYWAPEEGEPRAAGFLRWLEMARPGDEAPRT